MTFENYGLPQRVELRWSERVTHYMTTFYFGALSLVFVYFLAREVTNDNLSPEWPLGAMFALGLGAIAGVSAWRQWHALAFTIYSTDDDAEQNFSVVAKLAENESWAVRAAEPAKRLQLFVPRLSKEMCAARQVTVLFSGSRVAVNSIGDVTGSRPGVTWGRNSEIVEKIKGVLRVI